MSYDQPFYYYLEKRASFVANRVNVPERVGFTPRNMGKFMKLESGEADRMFPRDTLKKMQGIRRAMSRKGIYNLRNKDALRMFDEKLGR